MRSRHVFLVQKCLVGSLMLTCAGMLLLTGCKGTLGIFRSKQDKVDDTKRALVDNREAQVKEAAKHVYVTGLALDTETNRTPAIETASEFNELAQSTLGVPDVKDVTVLKEMLVGLLSTNQQLRALATKQKRELQSEVIALQQERDELQGKLRKAEDKRDAAYEDAAIKAAKYEKWRARLLWIVGILGGGFLVSIMLPALSTAFPVLAPFAAIFNGLFGTVARSIFRIAPKAMTTAGVVGKQAYDLSDRTLRDLVVAIQNVKIKNPQGFDEVLKEELKDATDPLSSRQKILEIKTKMATLDTSRDS